MSKYQNQLALALSIYLRLYLLLGVIELTLREVIPATLSKGSKKQSESASSFLVETQRFIECDTSDIVFIHIQNRGP